VRIESVGVEALPVGRHEDHVGLGEYEDDRGEVRGQQADSESEDLPALPIST
jgi:hypothetical protein